MTIQLELWQLITLLLAFFGFVTGAGKVLLAQIDKRLETRFEAQEKASAITAAGLKETLDRFTADDRRLSEDVARLYERVGRLEAAVKSSPSHEDINRLADKLGRLAETTSGIAGQLISIDNTQRLILARFTEKGLP